MTGLERLYTVNNARDLKFTHVDEWYIHKPESLLENEKQKDLSDSTLARQLVLVMNKMYVQMDLPFQQTTVKIKEKIKIYRRFAREFLNTYMDPARYIYIYIYIYIYTTIIE